MGELQNGVPGLGPGGLGPIISTVVFAFTCLAFFALGVTALMRGQPGRYRSPWVIFCILASVFVFLMAMANHITDESLALLTARSAMTTAAVAMLFFLLFGLFFTGWGKMGRILTTIGFVWLVTLLVLFWSTGLLLAGVEKTEFLRLAPRAGPMMPFYLLYVVFTYAAPLVLMTRTYSRSTGLKRTQTAYMLVAFAVGLVVSVGTLLPSLLKTQRLVAFLPALLFPLFPLTITTAIVRHRLWDVRTIAHKTTAWLVLLVLLVVPIYLGLWSTRETFNTLPNEIQGAIFFILILMGYGYLNLLKPRLDHLFQRRAYDWRRMVDGFSLGMAALVHPGEVAQRLCKVIDEALYPERVCVFFRREMGPIWERVSLPAGALMRFQPSLDQNDPVLVLLLSEGGAVERGQVVVDPAFVGLRREVTQFFDRAQAEVCLSLVQGGALLGLVLLGPKRNLRPYSRADLEFLEQLAAAASVGLSNGVLFEKVDRQRIDLEEFSAGLEQRVHERTEELEQVNRKLLSANEKLQEIDRLKARFFANISHELRTPLTLILAPLDSMLAGEMGPLQPNLQNQVRLIRKNGLSLLRLINNLLDLSRLEASRMRLHKRTIQLVPFVQGIVDLTRPLAHQDNIEVLYEPLDSPVVEGDEEKLERVVINLLSNAFKFTGRDGKVTVVVGQRGEHAFVAVQDTGIGIPQEEIPHIFDRFRQVDTSPTRAHGGTGIGLALVRELVRLHGGDVRVHSEEGKGSTFAINLPRVLNTTGIRPPRPTLTAVEPQEPKPEPEQPGPLSWEIDSTPIGFASELLASPEYRFMDIIATTDAELGANPQQAETVPDVLDEAPPQERVTSSQEMPEMLDELRQMMERRGQGTPLSVAQASGETVLVVEDNADLVKVIAPILSRSYRVLTAENGAVGLRLARDEMPSLVLCDVMMPVMDGLTLCRKLKEDQRTASIPVIMITARTGIEDSVVALDAGAADYVTKPFSMRELMSRIGAQLRTRQLDQAVARSERMAALGSTAGGMAHEILNPLNAIINGLEEMDRNSDPEMAEILMPVVQKSARRILETVEALKSFVRTGEGEWGPTDLDRGIEDTIRILSHVFKGITVNVELNLAHMVHCFGAQINQVVMNLLCNAADAAGEGGTVSIASEVVAGHGRIVVSDSGPGIPPEDRERVFFPYFTTKPAGKGTGMGLSITRQIVDQHGGTIRVGTSELGGAEFVVDLPIHPGTSQTGPMPMLVE